MIIAVTVFIVVMVVLMLNDVLENEQVNRKNSMLEIPVKAVEKRVQTKQGNYTKNIFKVTFEDLDTEERHTFKLAESEFDQIVEGDIGYLKYNRENYHSFKRDKLVMEFEEDTSSNTDTQFKIED